MSDRSDIAIVVVSFVALIVAIRPVLAAIEVIWVERGLFYTATALAAAPIGGDLDVPVVFLVGLFTGWLLLFCVDGTKRIQGLFVVAAVAIAFVPFASETGRILDAAARAPVATILGTVVGVATGSVSSRIYGTKRPVGLSFIEKLRWLQFPGAAGAFLGTTVLVVLFTLATYPLHTTRLLDVVVAMGSSVVMIAALSIFMRYDYRERIVTVSPPDMDQRYHGYTMGGLYEQAHLDYDGFPIDGDSMLLNAQNAAHRNDLPKVLAEVSFGFAASLLKNIELPFDRWFLRTVIVRSDGATTESVDLPESTNKSPLPEVLVDAVAYLWYYLRLSVPISIRQLARQDQSGGIGLVEADTVLLIAPSRTETDDLPPYAKEFVAICDRYADRIGTDVVIATTEARPAAEDMGLEMRSGAFKHRVGESLGLDNELIEQCGIYPTDRFNGDTPKGFDALLDRLSD